MWKPKYLNTDHVLYIAIADAIEDDIRQGKLLPNEKMPTQRAIAEIIGVNLTTVTRAYTLAKKRGMLYAITGKGTFVASNESMLLPVIGGIANNIIDLGLVGSVNLNSEVINGKVSKMLLNADMDKLLDYTPNEGLYEHRIAGQKWIEAHGVKAEIENVVICAGVMHAISCIQAGLLGGEDVIAVDSLTFTGFLNLSKLNNMTLLAIEMDSEGMVPEALDKACEKKGVRSVYLMPNLQNPTGIRMSEDRQRALAHVVKKHNLLVIEDDVYNLFDGKNRCSMVSIIPEHTVYICGTSKTLYPGLRIAYCIVPTRYLLEMKSAIMSTMWMASPISAEITTQLINSGMAFKIVEHKRKIIGGRVKLVERLFRNHKMNIEACSQFFWLRLPETVTALEIENTALLNNVRIIASDKFSVDRNKPVNAIRVSIAHIKEDSDLEKGLKIILRIIENPSLSKSVIM